MRPLTRRAAIAVATTALTVFTGTTTPRRTLFLIGDSWAAGLYADPDDALGQVAGRALGWATHVDAVSGTGYLNGAEQHIAYADRLDALAAPPRSDIAVVQGGSNDKDLSTAELGLAAERTLASVRRRFPGAKPVVLGPGPDPLPVVADQWAVDRVLSRVAEADRVPYISMLREDWVSPRLAADVIDSDNHHPTIEGQVYLGNRLAAALQRLYPEYWT